MKILVADKISPKGVAYLRAQKGFEVIEAYGSSPAQVLELVKDVHAIAVRSETKITAEVFAAAPLLSVLSRTSPKFMTTTEQVGRAMIKVAKDGYPRPVLESEDINAV